MDEPPMEDATPQEPESERPESSDFPPTGPMEEAVPAMNAEQPEMQEAASMEPEPSEPSRLGKFARRALRWVTAVVVIFGLGFAATWLVRVRPLMSEVESLEQRADQAETAQAQLQDRVDELDGVEQRNQELEAALLEARGHLDLLAVLVDVTSAQLAIAQEDTAAARLALEDTESKLDALADKQGEQPVAPLRERLALVLEELTSDVFAAQRDLEILSNTLVAMERELFSESN